MTRWLFAVWLLAIAVAAHMLFKVEQEVRLLEDELADIDLAILTESDALRALQADWSYLNRPERLAALSEEHLSFLPMRPRQITQFAALPMRLDDDKLLELALAREGVPMPKRKPPLDRLSLGPLSGAVLGEPALVGEPVADRKLLAPPAESAAPSTLGSDPRYINPVTGLPLIRQTAQPSTENQQ